MVFDDNENPSFKNSEPNFEDLDKYISFYDKAHKKAYDLTSLSTKVLVSWKEKPIELYVHVFTASVSSARLFGVVGKKLLRAETDRAGARTNAFLQEIIGKLKEHHSRFYRAHNFQWETWAACICKKSESDPLTIDRLIQQPPPANIIHLFARAPETGDQQLEEVRQNVSIGAAINADVRKDIEACEACLQKARELMRDLQMCLDDLAKRLESIQLKANARNDIVDVVQTQIRPSESQFGIDLLEEIEDLEDYEHD